MPTKTSPASIPGLISNGIRAPLPPFARSDENPRAKPIALEERTLLTARQSAAKQAAHEMFAYPPRRFTTKSAPHTPYQRIAIHDEMPRFVRGIEGIGIAGDVVRVYVREDIDPEVKIPDTIKDLPTEPVASSGFRAQSPARHDALSPVVCGVSVGHHRITYGTLGCLVDIPGSRCILSNSHVLTHPDGSVGDEIMQPGPYHSRRDAPSRRIACLTDHEPLVFGSAVNHIDAAIAALDDHASAIPEIMTIGRPVNPPVPAVPNQAVTKHGAYTGLTCGTVVDVSFDGNVYYDRFYHLTAYFENQIVIVGTHGPFSHAGDSGSLVVDNLGAHPVGLLFAGDDTHTLANPIQAVLNRFGATIVTA